MTSLSVPCPNSVTTTTAFAVAPISSNRISSIVSFPNAASSSPHSGLLRHSVRQVSVTKLQAQLREAAVKDSSDSSVPISNGSSPATPVIPDADSINVFMAQVSDLIKLVDSRDIVELELKQQDCELLIRKKEAIPLPPTPVAATQPTYYAPPPQQQASLPAVSARSPPPASSALALSAPVKAVTSSHPPLKCPMAGTFYRCPGPGEPPFVKVGDKVQKGQVICIIEAMKLMNEIEADQSGTISEILVEDGKPVSVDMPLFVIAP